MHEKKKKTYLSSQLFNRCSGGLTKAGLFTKEPPAMCGPWGSEICPVQVEMGCKYKKCTRFFGLFFYIKI